MPTARNAACPCGSGQKFKRCCGAAGGKPAEAGANVEDSSGAPSGVAWRGPALLMAIAVGAGAAMGTWRESMADGIAVGFALSLGVIMYLMARNPPEGKGTEGGAAINYGMGRKKSSSKDNKKPPNRRQRRQK